MKFCIQLSIYGESRTQRSTFNDYGGAALGNSVASLTNWKRKRKRNREGKGREVVEGAPIDSK